ncbi:MAG TPA: LysM peptidoglycan-binding domain-containing protein [Candidatus Eisenbacteria bacterium]|nr:LysM peptidoglycan-binding domain-containing protein [Candidatus Eisenbacteria bacterium]
MAVTLSMAAGLGFLACGCGKPVLRVADASLGDYYTEKEFRKLSEEQRQDYCQELAEQDSIYREEIADARTAGDRFAGRAQAARAAADSLARLADSLDTRVAELRRTPPAETPAAAGRATVTVGPGDSLWRISAREAVYGDGHRWNELYEANRDRIRDADRIYPGQELVVPR